MVSIKQKILQIWDNVAPTVRICCIKFAQRVVLAQTVASGAEHRVRLYKYDSKKKTAMRQKEIFLSDSLSLFLSLAAD